MADRPFDYVIVGAGSAGCVLAGRLSEDPNNRVLLIEAGGWDKSTWIHLPLGWGKILQKRLFDWGFEGEPEPTVDGRRVECMRGKVIGGSSSINAMAYVRGHRSDYDRWAKSGLDRWSYAHVLPYFRRMEAWQKGQDAYRGNQGPLSVVETRYEDPLIDAFLAAGQAVGAPLTKDYNGAQQEGLGRAQATIGRGRRCSSADAYLHPALKRPNLTVVVDALTHRVTFTGERATGVEYSIGSQVHRVTAEKEVILCAGVINSPQLLMLSGIGDPDELRAQGISVKAALPGVGKNLQDHLHAPVMYARRTPGPFQRNMRFDRLAASLLQARLFGTGFATELAGMLGFLKSDPSLSAPDTQVLFSCGPLGAYPYLKPFKQPFEDGFLFRAVMLRPQSRGRVYLASADPAKAMRIQFNFLATDDDKATMRTCFKTVRALGLQAPLQAFVAHEKAPGSQIRTDAELDSYIRRVAITAHHPLGTCRMGSNRDPGAVVNDQLCVNGVAGLRVVDASVMPDMVGGNINAPVMMIAEKAADLILQRREAAPANV